MVVTNSNYKDNAETQNHINLKIIKLQIQIQKMRQGFCRKICKNKK